MYVDYTIYLFIEGASQVTTVHDTTFNIPKTKNNINSLREHENKKQ